MALPDSVSSATIHVKSVSMPPAQHVTKHVLRHVLRHVVPVFLVFEKNGREEAAVFTSVVVSIRGMWMLLTAGHCIRDVQENISNGWSVKRARLIDSMSNAATHHNAIPFDWEAGAGVALSNDDTNDYGLVFLDDNSRRLLAANGVQPVDETAWDKGIPDDATLYAVAGVSRPRSSVTPDVAALRAVIVPIVPLPERLSAHFPESEAPSWYAEVMAPSIETLAGLSGGPVFVMRLEPSGELRYWLHAIQSAQASRFPEVPYIAAMLTRPLGHFLAEIMQRGHEAFKDDPAASA